MLSVSLLLQDKWKGSQTAVHRERDQFYSAWERANAQINCYHENQIQQLRRASLCIPPSLKVGEQARAGRQLHGVTVSHRLAVWFCHPSLFQRWKIVASISGSKETAVLFSSQHEEGRRKSPGK